MKNYKHFTIFTCIQFVLLTANSADVDSTQRFTDSQAKEREHVRGRGHVLMVPTDQTRKRGGSDEASMNSADSSAAEAPGSGVASNVRGSTSQSSKLRSGTKILRFNSPD